MESSKPWWLKSGRGNEFKYKCEYLNKWFFYTPTVGKIIRDRGTRTRVGVERNESPVIYYPTATATEFNAFVVVVVQNIQCGPRAMTRWISTCFGLIFCSAGARAKQVDPLGQVIEFNQTGQHFEQVSRLYFISVDRRGHSHPREGS